MPSSVLTVAAKQAVPSQTPAAIRRAAEYVPTAERNVGPTDRLVSLGLGSCLAVCGLTGRRMDPLSLLAGGYLIYRGLSGNCVLYQALGVGTEGPRGPEAVIPARGGVKVEHAVTINKPAAELYRFWRNLSQLPQFMDHLKEVRENGNRSHWAARGPLGVSVEWDAELITDTPNETISWRSLPGSDVDTAGSVHFKPAPGGRGTEVHVELEYAPPGGKAAATVAKLFGEEPATQLADDLRRFKQVLETGEVVVSEGSPRGHELRRQLKQRPAQPIGEEVAA
jgi:uncharacterized membrane protein